MIDLKNLVEVGKFQRTHALKGELNAILDIEPEFFEDGLNPMIVELEGCVIPFYADSIRTKGQLSYLIKLDRVDSEEKARQFVNKIIFAEREQLKDFMAEGGEELFDENEWDGYDIYDVSSGLLGKLIRVDNSTANILLVIEDPEGDELFIPLADEFIHNVDPDKRTITVSIPEGLLDINKKKNEE